MTMTRQPGTSKKRSSHLIAGLLIAFVLLASFGTAIAAGVERSKDVYYHTDGIPSGPPAPSSEAIVYPRYGSFDSRLLVWFVTQQHTYFGGFVLALPMFCMIMEFVGLMVRDRSTASRYDQMARDFLKVALLALSLTAVVGSIMLALFIALYPSFMSYMGGTFKTMMPIYAFIFMAESTSLIVYYYSWERFSQGAAKWAHVTIGVLANAIGTALLFLANAWSPS